MQVSRYAGDDNETKGYVPPAPIALQLPKIRHQRDRGRKTAGGNHGKCGKCENCIARTRNWTHDLFRMEVLQVILTQLAANDVARATTEDVADVAGV